MDRTLKCDHSLESCWAVLYCAFLNCAQFIIFEDLLILDFLPSGVKGLNRETRTATEDGHRFVHRFSDYGRPNCEFIRRLAPF